MDTEAPVALIMGSRSDWPTMRRAGEALTELGVAWRARVISAHRTPSTGKLVSATRHGPTAGGRSAGCHGSNLGTFTRKFPPPVILSPAVWISTGIRAAPGAYTVRAMCYREVLYQADQRDPVQFPSRCVHAAPRFARPAHRRPVGTAAHDQRHRRFGIHARPFGKARSIGARLALATEPPKDFRVNPDFDSSE